MLSWGVYRPVTPRKQRRQRVDRYADPPGRHTWAGPRAWTRNRDVGKKAHVAGTEETLTHTCGNSSGSGSSSMNSRISPGSAIARVNDQA